MTSEAKHDWPVFLITGGAASQAGGTDVPIHVLVCAPDDDSAVRQALEALEAEGFAEAEFDQIGMLDGEPFEEPHMTAYQNAIEGEIAIIKLRS